MKNIPLYCYVRPDGGVSVSPVMPDGECTEMFRLVADEGCILTDGVNRVECVDTDEPEVWEEEISDTEALAIITGGAV